MNLTFNSQEAKEIQRLVKRIQELSEELKQCSTDRQKADQYLKVSEERRELQLQLAMHLQVAVELQVQ